MEGVCSAQVQAQNKHSGGDRDAMKKNVFCLALGAMLFALCASAEAQQAEKVRRIGFLGGAFPASNPARHEALRQGLRALGWVEGKNITIEFRFAEGNRDRLPKLALELARLPVDLIVTGGPAATRAVKEANITVPIIMGFDNDPVGSGFVASLARSGGNITGLSTLSPEISGKQLELLKEVIPKLSRVAVLGNSTEPGNAQAQENWKSWRGHSDCSFITWTYKKTRILSRHLELRPGNLPMPLSF